MFGRGEAQRPFGFYSGLTGLKTEFKLGTGTGRDHWRLEGSQD